MRWIHGKPSTQSHERAAELILGPDQAACSMRALDLLARVRQVGPAQAERMLTRANIAPTRTLCALTQRQRAGLTALLRLRPDQPAQCTRTKAA